MQQQSYYNFLQDLNNQYDFWLAPTQQKSHKELLQDLHFQFMA
jgi:hypothetical protein